MTKKRHTPKPKTSPGKASEIKRKSQKREAQKRKTRNRFNISWLWIGLGVILVVATAFLLLKPNNPSSEEISVTQAYQKYQQGGFFLDVREQQEWSQGHIPNSINIPLEMLQSRLGELSHDREIILVCHLGQRSKMGMAILQQAGFDKVTCMSGGIQAWTTAGYPLEGSNQANPAPY
jgi:rhodanese-related sulfurtransferase